MAALSKVECTVATCSNRIEAGLKYAAEKGWRMFVESKEHGAPNNRWRTHLGWCPSCAKKYGVDLLQPKSGL